MLWRFAGRGGEGIGKQTCGGHHLNWRPAENKEIVTQCAAEETALHFQGKTICVYLVMLGFEYQRAEKRI